MLGEAFIQDAQYNKRPGQASFMNCLPLGLPWSLHAHSLSSTWLADHRPFDVLPTCLLPPRESPSPKPVQRTRFAGSCPRMLYRSLRQRLRVVFRCKVMIMTVDDQVILCCERRALERLASWQAGCPVVRAGRGLARLALLIRTCRAASPPRQPVTFVDFHLRGVRGASYLGRLSRVRQNRRQGHSVRSVLFGGI